MLPWVWATAKGKMGLAWVVGAASLCSTWGRSRRGWKVHGQGIGGKFGHGLEAVVVFARKREHSGWSGVFGKEAVDMAEMLT